MEKKLIKISQSIEIKKNRTFDAVFSKNITKQLRNGKVINSYGREQMREETTSKKYKVH